MITASKTVIGVAIGGVAAVVGAIVSTTEPEGLFQLHAAIVLGVGGGMLKIGWEMVKTGRQTVAILKELVKARAEDRKANDSERDVAVGKVMTVVKNGHDELMAGVGALVADLEERRKDQRRKGERRGG